MARSFKIISGVTGQQDNHKRQVLNGKVHTAAIKGEGSSFATALAVFIVAFSGTAQSMVFGYDSKYYPHEMDTLESMTEFNIFYCQQTLVNIVQGCTNSPMVYAFSLAHGTKKCKYVWKRENTNPRET